jgi:pimeloyl-ACP methyl ester carboxylesterase
MSAIPIPARLLAHSSALSTLAILAALLAPSRARVHLPAVTRRPIDALKADLYLPPRGAAAPGIVLVMGTLREGRRYPLLVSLAESIAACNYAVLVPELGRLSELVVGDEAVEDLVASACALTRQQGVLQAPIGLFGFSLGGALALLAAADDRLQDRVACVMSMGAYFSLRDMLAAATTGVPRIPAGRSSLAAPSIFAVAATLVASLPEADRRLLQRALDDDPASPLGAMSRVSAGSVGPQAQAVLQLLANRDPAALALLTRNVNGADQMMARLSPERVIERVLVPVFALHDERDSYVPVQQQRLMRAATAGRQNFKFFTIRLLEHTEPDRPPVNPMRFASDYVPGLIALFRFAHRSLAAVRRGLSAS